MKKSARFCSIILLISSMIVCAKKALIIGVTGQDGSYLAELLLEKGYEVHGVQRRASTINTSRITQLYNNEFFTKLILRTKKNKQFFLHYGDVTDATNIIRLVKEVEPDEIYNLSAQSHVRISFDVPLYTAEVDALGVLRVLEAVRILGLQNKTKIYQASTSEMFGKVQEVPQTECTPFYPRSPYGVAKVYAHWIIKNYREAYDIFACSGILFNHESPRRGHDFVTCKIARAAARISCGLQDVLHLGNLDAKRDWGHAKDYVEAMWLMLQQDVADDYVIATGQTHSVRKFAQKAFAYVGIEIAWRGQGLDEIGYDINTGEVVIQIDPYFFRPTEVDVLLGNPEKAKKILGWSPQVTFEKLIREMVEHELYCAKKEIKNDDSEIQPIITDTFGQLRILF